MNDRIEAMRRNPAGDWRLADISALCREYGIDCDPPRGGGSHYKISHPGMAEIITVPSRRPIKAVYVRKVIRFVDRVRAMS